MLNDLSALTPPLLVAAAFLIAAGAFIRRSFSDSTGDRDRDPG